MIYIYIVNIFKLFNLSLLLLLVFFPTCQVRVVRFYVSCLVLLLLVLLLLSLSSSSSCSTATRDPQCSLSDLNHDHPRPVEVRQGTLGGDGRGWGPAGNTGRGWSWLRSGREHWAGMVVVEVRQGTLGGDGRGWGPAGNTGRGWSWCSLPDLNHDHPRPVFPAGPQPRPSTPSVPCRTSTASIHAKCSLPGLMRYAR